MLAGLNCGSEEFSSDYSSLDELERLLDTSGGICKAKVIQNKEAPDARTLLGEGKIEEIKTLCQNVGADLLIFDNELSPSQVKNIENITDVRVLDRSQLILDIFALHAVTSEGKVQVELAQLQYTLPRLTGKGIELSRLGGGIGTRGPGESKLETDRRHVRRRIAAFKEQLEEIKQNRLQQRRMRDKSEIPTVALVGYTNAGKSTLLNKLTDADVLAYDKLFATLSPTTKKYVTENGFDILFTDTVGFIRKLPHHLVESFKSTLEELTYADLLLHVADASSSELDAQMKTVSQVIKDLGAADKPIITVFNKCDICNPDILPNTGDSVIISAKEGTGLDKLVELIENKLGLVRRTLNIKLPYGKQSMLSRLHELECVKEMRYEDDGIFVTVEADNSVSQLVEDYII